MTLVIAHRGASAVEYENSLAAFKRAVALGADGIELDIHETADGELVVHHDPDVGGRPIAGLPFSIVSRHRLKNDEPIPTLAQALEAIGPDTLVFIEVKGLTPTGDQRLFDTMDGGPAVAHYRVHGFDHRIIRRLCTERPGLLGGILSSSYSLDPSRDIAEAAAEALWEDQILIDVPLVAQVHDGGFKIFAWTVDDPTRIQTLAAMGVDGICTNRPDSAREALA